MPQTKSAPRDAELALVNIQGLSTLTGIPVRSIRTLVGKRAIPCIRPGHRSLFFQPAKVVSALEKFEVKAVGR